VQQRADRIAKRFMQAIGFTHGLFNMEFAYDQQTGQIKVIEVNPRMAAQFSDLYARVDGVNLHEIALALSRGMDPSLLSIQEPVAGCASSFVYRSFDPAKQIAMPAADRLAALKASFPDNLLLSFPKSSRQIQRDFKWLDSYRYGILHLGGNNPDQLRERCERASAILGWPAPYAGKTANLAGFRNDKASWPGDIATERAPG
jgi:hypothetical protein